jgi:ComF family protein
MEPYKHVIEILDFIYPRFCSACTGALSPEEANICLDCRQNLPYTNFHFQPGNPVEQIFWGRFPIVAGTAYLKLKKATDVQRLIHNIKYRAHTESGIMAGRWFGADMSRALHFQMADAVVPVPLHPKKQRIRGYNQAELIAEGISQSMQIPMINDALIRKIFSKTQTRKSRFNRWKNVSRVFEVINESELKNKHLLLVDDVITSGATLEACALAISEKSNAKISIAVLAISG